MFKRLSRDNPQLPASEFEGPPRVFIARPYILPVVHRPIKHIRAGQRARSLFPFFEILTNRFPPNRPRNFVRTRLRARTAAIYTRQDRFWETYRDFMPLLAIMEPTGIGGFPSHTDATIGMQRKQVVYRDAHRNAKKPSEMELPPGCDWDEKLKPEVWSENYRRNRSKLATLAFIRLSFLHWNCIREIRKKNDMQLSVDPWSENPPFISAVDCQAWPFASRREAIVGERGWTLWPLRSDSVLSRRL